MNVTGFLYVSLCSSTVQFHDSLGSSACACLEAGFSSQNGDSVWGMYYRKSAFFLLVKELNENDILWISFLLTVGSVCRVKRFITVWRQFRRRRRGLNEVAGFDELVKRWGCLSMLVEVMSRNTYFFSGSNIICFTFYIHLWSICRIFLAYQEIVSVLW
jgi:hypothetical protein